MPCMPVTSFFFNGSHCGIIIPNCPAAPCLEIWMSPRYRCRRGLCPQLAYTIPDYFSSRSPHWWAHVWLLAAGEQPWCLEEAQGPLALPSSRLRGVVVAQPGLVCCLQEYRAIKPNSFAHSCQICFPAGGISYSLVAKNCK